MANQANTLQPGIRSNRDDMAARSGSALARVEAAQAMMRQDRAHGVAALYDLFRQGTAPDALNGPCSGQLVAMNIAPVSLFTFLTTLYLPWQGKTFDAATSQGSNIFSRSAYIPSHILFPFYRRYMPRDDKTFLAFPFRTYIAAGKEDPDVQVLKIDYDSADNPKLSVRRVLDELVQLDDNYYLGKAHLHGLRGGWRMVAFFALQRMS